MISIGLVLIGSCITLWLPEGGKFTWSGTDGHAINNYSYSSVTSFSSLAETLRGHPCARCKARTKTVGFQILVTLIFVCVFLFFYYLLLKKLVYRDVLKKLKWLEQILKLLNAKSKYCFPGLQISRLFLSNWGKTLTFRRYIVLIRSIFFFLPTEVGMFKLTK